MFFSSYPDTFCAPLLCACVKIQENKIKWCCLLAFCFCTHVSSDCGWNWAHSYLALCRVFLSHRCFLCYEKLHWVSVLSCVCVCARTRETENKRSRRRLMRTHIAHTAYFFFFFLFFLPPRSSLSSALERVRSICVMWQKTAQPRLGEREEWKQSIYTAWLSWSLYSHQPNYHVSLLARWPPVGKLPPIKLIIACFSQSLEG